jgi:hypothetical protein
MHFASQLTSDAGPEQNRPAPKESRLGAMTVVRNDRKPL